MPLWAWIVFYALVLIMLVADLKMFGRKGEHEVNVNEAFRMTAVWIGVSLLFCAGIYFFYPGDSHEMALEFLAGYLIEKSLSMDNLFVCFSLSLALSGSTSMKCSFGAFLAHWCCEASSSLPVPQWWKGLNGC